MSTFRSHIDKSRKELKREKKLLAEAKEDKNQADLELEEKNKIVQEYGNLRRVRKMSLSSTASCRTANLNC